jgi:hypothetical protein
LNTDLIGIRPHNKSMNRIRPCEGARRRIVRPM